MWNMAFTSYTGNESKPICTHSVIIISCKNTELQNWRKNYRYFTTFVWKKTFVRQIGKTLYRNNYSFFKSDEANEEQKSNL